VIRAYLALTAVQVAGAIEISGTGAALAGVAALLFAAGGLVHAQRWAWTLLVVWNALVALVAAVALVTGDGHLMEVWELGTSAVLLGLLGSRPMRNHIIARDLLDTVAPGSR